MPLSSGRLVVEPDKIYVAVDPGIVELCRALIPSDIRPNRQRYEPHITVVRNEMFVVDGELPDVVEFEYDPAVIQGEVYWWLRAYAPELTKIRIDLGLSATSTFSRPPDGEKCFHITIGNKKTR